jgi:hypothetical protein
MASLSKNSRWSPALLAWLLICSVLAGELFARPADDRNTAKLESAVTAALRKSVNARGIAVKVELASGNGSEIQKLIVKMENVEIGQLAADRMTILIESPVLDRRKLEKDEVLEFRSQGKCQVGIFASPGSLERYLQRKAEQFNKKSVHFALKFTPPYIECTYDVLKSEIASESVELLKKFVPGDKIEGYAAFRLDAKDNGLIATASKVITNHFLLPGGLLRAFESKFNPFDQIPVVAPFQYTINKLTVQAKYVFMSN